MKPFKNKLEMRTWASAYKNEVIEDHLNDIAKLEILIKRTHDLHTLKAYVGLQNILTKSVRAVRATRVTK